MSRVKVIRAEGTTNLCPNPSVERATTGWASSGLATFERSAAWSARGAWSIRGVANSTTDAIQAPTFTAAAATAYTATAWVRILSGTWRPKAGGTNGPTLGVGVHRVEVMFTGAGAAARLELEAMTLDGGSAEAFVDGVQYEAKAGYSTTYVDGDQDGGKWAGTPHASTSSRDARERSGGRWVDLRDDLDLLYADIIGVGMPPLVHVSQSLGQRDGAVLQRVKANPAVLTLRAQIYGGSLPALHALRRELVELIRPEPLSSFAPLRLAYSGSDETLEIDAHYLAGLEASIPKPSNRERMDLQMVAYDPRWSEELDAGASLATAENITNANRIIARVGGVWRAFGVGANDQVAALTFGTDGKVYVGGDFSSIGGVAANNVAYWDPADEAWHAMGSGASGGSVEILVVGPDGRIYAGGKFTAMGGVSAADRVAVWDPVASTWAALGTGFDATVWALMFAVDGFLYAGGTFTTADGSPALGIARWNGSGWDTVADVDLKTGAFNGVVALAQAPNGDIYAGGDFNLGGGSDFEDLAKFDGSSWSQVSSEPSSIVLHLGWGPDGNLYLSGFFQTPVRRIGLWNGQQIRALGAGLDLQARWFAFDSRGELWVAGSFTQAGDLDVSDRIARWTGSSWLPVPLDLPGAASSEIVEFTGTDDVYIGGTFAGTAVAPGRTTVSNPGSAEAFPVVRISGPGNVRALLNLTTDQEILFDGLVLAAGEILTVDLRAGRKHLSSSFRGDCASYVVAGSDVAAFALAPGDNVIGLLIAATEGTKGRSATQVSGSSTSIVFTKPAGVVATDYLLAQISVLGGSGLAITPPAGFTLIERADSGAAAGDVVVAVYGKVAGGSEPASYTFTLGTSRAFQARLSAFTGVDNAAPVSGDAGAFALATVNHVIPSVAGVAGGRVRTIAGGESPTTDLNHPVHMSAGEFETASRPRLEIWDHSPIAGTGDTGEIPFTADAAADVAVVAVALRPTAMASPTADLFFRPKHWGAE